MSDQPQAPGVADDEQSILLEAHRLVYGPRQASYGHPLDNFQTIAELWSAVLGHTVSAREAALCMVQVKVARELHKPGRDNRSDGAGYFGVLDLIETEWERRHASNE